MGTTILRVFARRSPAQVFDPVILAIPVEMPTVQVTGPAECLKDQPVNRTGEGLAVPTDAYDRVSPVETRGNDLSNDEPSPRLCPPNAPKAAGLVFGKARNLSPFFRFFPRAVSTRPCALLIASPGGGSFLGGKIVPCFRKTGPAQQLL